GLSSLIPPKDGDNNVSEPERPLIEEQGFHSVPPPGGESIAPPPQMIFVEEASPALAEEAPQEEFRSHEAVFHIEVNRIHPNPYQPRREFDDEKLRELAESIREYGIIQPLVVSRIQKEVDSGSRVEYQIIAGERRYRAALLVGLPTVPVVIRKSETPKGNIEVALVENLQRSDLNPLETARAY
ncbi:MAG: ParB/RepB/Spo0J family partition protein, partial [Patescibacteria group bacterium]